MVGLVIVGRDLDLWSCCLGLVAQPKRNRTGVPHPSFVCSGGAFSCELENSFASASCPGWQGDSVVFLIVGVLVAGIGVGFPMETWGITFHGLLKGIEVWFCVKIKAQVGSALALCDSGI